MASLKQGPLTWEQAATFQPRMLGRPAYVTGSLGRTERVVIKHVTFFPDEAGVAFTFFHDTKSRMQPAPGFELVQEFRWKGGRGTPPEYQGDRLVFYGPKTVQVLLVDPPEWPTRVLYGAGGFLMALGVLFLVRRLKRG